MRALLSKITHCVIKKVLKNTSLRQNKNVLENIPKRSTKRGMWMTLTPAMPPENFEKHLYPMSLRSRIIPTRKTTDENGNIRKLHCQLC